MFAPEPTPESAPVSAGAPLLSYTPSTTPSPLQVSADGTIRVVANNPGGYSDQPAQDYVAIGSIVFDFGPRGGDAADLTASDGSAIAVTPPTGWGAPTVTGLRFTFTPPTDGANLFPNLGLTFTFAKIPVNAQPGTVTLTITETASSPGDPEQPSLYPEIASAARPELVLIGKFPAGISVGPLVATPPNVPAGGGTTLSWSGSAGAPGSAGATYALIYGNTTVTHHADKSLLQPNDLYPDPARKDPPLALEIDTIFTLQVSYTPPGGDPIVFQPQVTVGVYYPDPVIETFTLSPAWVLPNQPNGVSVTLTWQTSQTAGEGPVGFVLSPPLSEAELEANSGNNFFNTAHTAGGTAAFTFLQGHRVTLTALGPPGTAPAMQALNCLSFQFPPAFTGDAGSPIQLAFTPDGNFGFLANLGPQNGQTALSVIEFVAKDDPTTWTSTSFLQAQACVGVATTPDGTYALALAPAALHVLTIVPGQSPDTWAETAISLAVVAFMQDVVVTPDGTYAFCGGLFGVVAVAIPAGTPPSAWTTTNVTSTGLIDLGVTPDGRYLFGCGTQGGNSGLMVIEIDKAAAPPAWNSHFIPYASAISNAVSLDSRYLFVSSQPGSVGVIDTTRDPDPAKWSIAPLMTAQGPSPEIVVSPDGQFAFAASLAQPDGSAPAVLTAIQILPGTTPSDWPRANVFETSADGLGLLAITPDGRYIFTATGAPLQLVALTPPAAPPPASVSTERRRLLASAAPVPLLAYSLSTDPQPLQVSTAGAITIVASNPGGYSDQPAQDYVTASAIVFDFGLVGSGGSDLTSTAGPAWTITPPDGWGAPAVTGLRFTFTPPAGQTRLFAKDGLTFVFAGFTVNDTTGSPIVTITETASTPGDPANPVYPAFPTQVAVWAQVLGKFPRHFTVGGLDANPPNVPAGASATLSWSGTPGAVYELGYGRNNVTAHKDGSPLLPTDLYPDPARGDAPLSLETNTPFTLTVTYTPPGGGTPVSLQRQVTVDVYYPDPSVTSFTLSPAQFAPQAGPVAVEFTWSTADGVPGAPVSFSVDPPLSADELALNATNALFNTTHTAAGGAGFTFTQGHLITLTVLGRDGTQPASQTITLTSCATIAPLSTGALDNGIAFTPDNTLAIIPQLGGGWRILEVTADLPSTWRATQVNTSYPLGGIAITPDGKYALSISYLPTPGLAVLIIDPTIPAPQWPTVMISVGLPIQTPYARVAVSPDGRSAFANSSSWLAKIDLSSALPMDWTVTVLDTSVSSGAVAVTPTGSYVFAASSGGTTVYQFETTPDSSSLTKTLIPFQATDIAVTLDGSFALLVNSATGFAGAMRIDPGTSPELWQITPFPGTFSSPSRIAVTPDGRFAFISSTDDNMPIAWVWVDATQPPSAWTVKTFGQTQSGFPATGISPDGSYAFVASNQTLVPIAIFPPAAKARLESEAAPLQSEDGARDRHSAS